MNQELQIGVLTPLHLFSRSEGRYVLQLLASAPEALVPQLWGSWEPVNRPFHPAQIDAIVPEWDAQFLFKRRKPRVDGAVLSAYGPAPLHGMLSLAADSRAVDPDDVVRFLLTASSSLDADFGFVHLPTEQEAPFYSKLLVQERLDPASGRYAMAVTTHTIERWLPDLFWGTVLGVPYVQLIGRDPLLRTPVFRAQELATGAVYLQLTGSPLDLASDFEEVAGVRKRARGHLDEAASARGRRGLFARSPAGLFYDPAMGDSQGCLIPELRLQPGDPSQATLPESGEPAGDLWATRIAR